MKQMWQQCYYVGTGIACASIEFPVAVPIQQLNGAFLEASTVCLPQIC